MIEEFQVVTIIGRVPEKYSLGINDSWIVIRIKEMINIGMLEIASTASDDAPIYNRVLRKKGALHYI